MPWEALIWSALAALSPAAAAVAWPRWKPRLGITGETLERIAPWLHGVGPAYLAIIRGAILSRDAGLRGHDLVAWLAGGVVCAALLGCILAVARRPGLGLPWPEPLQALADEPRWALYRAAGALWFNFNSHALGTGVGLGWAALEWALTNRTRLGNIRQHPEATGTLLRLASSTLIFLATRNFWLTCLSGGIILAVLRRPKPSGLPQGLQ